MGGIELKARIFNTKLVLMIVSIALLMMHVNLSAALLVLQRPVPLKTEVIAQLSEASASTDNTWRLITFGFTRCKDICPISLGNLHMLIQAAEAQQIRVQGIFVSIDPDRDSDAALSGYTDRFDSAISYLRFEDKALEEFIQAFGVEVTFLTKNEGNMQNYQVDHSTTAFLVDPEGRIKVMFDAARDAAAVAKLFQESRGMF
ncbi:MAG: SCO family protein [Nitrosomonas sp.]|jgi:protein SCO1/2|nr:SCO family protein [Nitrosomonas sp.]